MVTKLPETFDRLEESRLALLSDLESLGDWQLNVKPQDHKWSIIQIVCHLILAEQMSMRYLRKYLADPSQLERSGVGSALKSMALNLLLRSRLKFKSPGRSTDIPDYQEFVVTRRRWDEVRSEMKTLIQHFPHDKIDHIVFQHPVVGPLNICQTLSFLRDHFTHHERQVRDLLPLEG